MICKNCSKSIPDDSVFCSYCGTKQSIVCPSCGTELNDSDIFCRKCGTKIINTDINCNKEPATDEKYFEFHDYHEGVCLDGYNGPQTECKIVIPNELKNGKKVIAINNMAFAHLHDIKEVILPDYLSIIGESAFEMSGITYIKIPQSVTYIGPTAFSRCENLVIEVPDSLTKIGYDAFYMCKEVKKY